MHSFDPQILDHLARRLGLSRTSHRHRERCAQYFPQLAELPAADVYAALSIYLGVDTRPYDYILNFPDGKVLMLLSGYTNVVARDESGLPFIS